MGHVGSALSFRQQEQTLSAQIVRCVIAGDSIQLQASHLAGQVTTWTVMASVVFVYEVLYPFSVLNFGGKRDLWFIRELNWFVYFVLFAASFCEGSAQTQRTHERVGYSLDTGTTSSIGRVASVVSEGDGLSKGDRLGSGWGNFGRMEEVLSLMTSVLIVFSSLLPPCRLILCLVQMTPPTTPYRSK